MRSSSSFVRSGIVLLGHRSFGVLRDEPRSVGDRVGARGGGGGVLTMMTSVLCSAV